MKRHIKALQNSKRLITTSMILIGLVGCTRPIPQDEANGFPITGVVDTEIPTSGVLNCPSGLVADMRYREGDIITPRLYKTLSQFGCNVTMEYKTRYLNGITVAPTQEEIAKRCRTEAAFLYKKDFWLTSRNNDYTVHSASFLLDKFRGSVLQTNLSGTRNVQCFATVQALFKEK